MFDIKKLVITAISLLLIFSFIGCGEADESVSVANEEVPTELKEEARTEGQKLKQKIENDSGFLRKAVESTEKNAAENLFGFMSSMAEETFEEALDVATETLPGVGLSAEEEAKIAELVKEEIFKDYRRSEDEALRGYVQGVADRMVKEIEALEESVEVIILDTEEIGAYALPDRNIIFTRGFLELLENEAQLAGVMGHELGHIYLKHPIRRIKAGRIPARVLEEAGVMDEATLVEHAGEMASAVLTHPLSQPAEFSADAYGAVFSLQACYNGHGLIGALELLDEISDNERKFLLENILATHPKTSQRVAVLEYILSKVVSPPRPELNFNESYKKIDQLVKNVKE